jgi:hypothetical protein
MLHIYLCTQYLAMVYGKSVDACPARENASLNTVKDARHTFFYPAVASCWVYNLETNKKLV